MQKKGPKHCLGPFFGFNQYYFSKKSSLDLPKLSVTFT
jgi:hypothetical protein